MYVGQGRRTGFLPTGANDECYFGLYDNSTNWGGMVSYGDVDGQDYAEFRKTAQKFNLRRASCHGHWQLNRTSTILVGGDCNLSTPIDSSILQAGNMVVFPYDMLPEIQHVLSPFDGSDAQTIDDIWLNATYAVSIVTSYWARALYLLLETGGEFPNYAGRYTPADERIVSRRPTLNAAPLLYVVLIVQPALTLLALAIIAWLYTVPIGRGFGIVSILSGFDSSGSRHMLGAGFSGKLKAPVILEVTTKSAAEALHKEGTDNDIGLSIRYRVVGGRSHPRQREETRMLKGQKYG